MLKEYVYRDEECRSLEKMLCDIFDKARKIWKRYYSRALAYVMMKVDVAIEQRSCEIGFNR